MRFAPAFAFSIWLVVNASAQTLLYQWNFNNAAGAGLTLMAAPSYIAPSMTGGVLTNLNGGSGLSAPLGSGLYGGVNATDLGIVSSSTYRSAAGLPGAGLGNLSSLNAFTVSLWFNLNASVTNFSSLNGGALLSRLVNIATTNSTSADGDELYFALNTGTNLQFGVNRASTGNITATNQFIALAALPAPATMTNNWLFVAATYTNNNGGTVNLFTGTKTSNAVAVATMTNVGMIAWSPVTNFIFIGNRGDGARSLPGTIDNVSFFSGVQTLAQIITVQSNTASQNENMPTAGVPIVAPSNTIYIGSSITITSAFSGALPLSFQWGTDGASGGALTNILDATNSVLTSTPPRTGTFQYALVITNSFGSVTGAVATVSVQPMPGTANVYVSLSQPLATMPSHGIGVCTATYDNDLISSSIAPLLVEAGVSAVRFPGGSYADAFNWQTTTMNGGSYINADDSFANFMFTIVNSANAHAVVTVNYGSNPANDGGGDTNVAASWVAYANVTNRWNVKYWEIGNEIYGNGFYGTNSNWEYDLHYPETNAETRVGQSSLSPAAYGTNTLQFIGAMKANDPTIKCGVSFSTDNSEFNSQLLGVAVRRRTSLLFIIIRTVQQLPCFHNRRTFRQLFKARAPN